MSDSREPFFLLLFSPSRFQWFSNLLFFPCDACGFKAVLGAVSTTPSVAASVTTTTTAAASFTMDISQVGREGWEDLLKI